MKQNTPRHIPRITNAAAEDVQDEGTRSWCMAKQAAIIDCRWQAVTTEVVLHNPAASEVDNIVTLDGMQYLGGNTYVPPFHGIASEAFYWDKPLQNKVC